MPVNLVVRAVEPALRNLPSGLDRRGIFQLCLRYDYLRVAASAEYINVRRTLFQVSPADWMTIKK